MRATFVAALMAAALSFSANAIPTVTTKGQYFFTSDGNRWFIKGVAYQLYSTGTDAQVDPFVDINQCTRDANLMHSIGVNALRTYHVRPALDHSACMAVFANLGIYLFVDLDDYPSQLSENNLAWTNQQKAYFQAVMDEFSQFDNVAGFFIGNEVINSGATSAVAPYIRAALRDMKAYRASKNYRNIPIGYSHADVQSIGQNLENYWACTTPNQPASGMLDFYALNSYRWCGSNTFQGSGYSDILNQTANYPIPIFMSETGCNQPEPRLFQDQVALLGPEMNNVWSGAIIYEWLQEDNRYGLVTYEGGNADALSPQGVAPPGGWPRAGTPTPVQPDFNNLKTVWAGLNPTGVKINAYTPSLSPLACPTFQAGSWMVDPNAPLPSASGAVTPVPAAFNVHAGNAGASASTAVAVATTSVAIVTSTKPLATTTVAVVTSTGAAVSGASSAPAASSAVAAASSAASAATVAAASATRNAAARPTGVTVGFALALAGVFGVVA